MKITSLELNNIRSFKKLNETKFSDKINVFIGPNNCGKSTILNSIFILQRQNLLSKSDITIGEKDGQIFIKYNGVFGNLDSRNQSYVNINLSNNSRNIYNNSGASIGAVNGIQEMEPNNLIYPYLSKRKAVVFQDQINQQNTNSVLGNFTNLYSKIDRLITPQFQPGNLQYTNACNDILGFEISTLASQQGKKGVYFVYNQEHIPLTAMGEGVTNIIGLITDLCIAENKIFLIEEPENDIHPTALKKLLKFIISKSDTNQFFISTHSNIVMKYLGGEIETKIFSISSSLSDKNREKMFLSSLEEVPNIEEERRIVLENLGYEFNDFGLWKAWLFLEESSAERLIRDYFINWYNPELNGILRTISANSVSQIIPKFEDFNRLFVFLHLEPQYKNKAWVIIDNGDDELRIIEKLKENYVKSGWNDNNFGQFTEHDFELYYPKIFQEEVKTILGIVNKKDKRMAKKELLEKVLEWIKSNEETAREEFKKSAASVIKKINEISKSI